MRSRGDCPRTRRSKKSPPLMLVVSCSYRLVYSSPMRSAKSLTRHRCPIRWAGIRTRVPRVPGSHGRAPIGFQVVPEAAHGFSAAVSGGLRRRTVRQPMPVRRIPMPRILVGELAYLHHTAVVVVAAHLQDSVLVPDAGRSRSPLNGESSPFIRSSKVSERGYARAFKRPSAYASERDQRVASPSGSCTRRAPTGIH